MTDWSSETVGLWLKNGERQMINLRPNKRGAFTGWPLDKLFMSDPKSCRGDERIRAASSFALARFQERPTFGASGEIGFDATFESLFLFAPVPAAFLSSDSESAAF
jgi:hypothetical protein